MSAAEVERTVGSIVAGKYRLIRVLGRGGMGIVFEAEHTMTLRRVAVKVLHAHHRQTGDAAKRFLNEAQAAGRMIHPNIVEVLDAGEDSDQSLYIVLELLHGYDLATLLMRKRQLDVADTITIVAQVLQALAVAHSQGIVHRDIKPENIYLTQASTGDQVVKILDFGISKAMNPGGSQALNVTQTNTTVGTPHYMSPEQARGERTLDTRADLWAVGVVLYECLAGKVPFDGETYNDQIVKVITEPHPPLSQFDVPYELSQIVDRALEKDRSRRYLKAADMLADIRQFIERHREYAAVPPQVLKVPHNLPDAPAPIASVPPPRPVLEGQYDFGSDTVRSPAIVSLYDTTNEDVPTTVRAIDSDHDGSRLTPLAGARIGNAVASVPPPARTSEPPRRSGPAALFSGPNRERNFAIAAGLVAFAILAGGLSAFLASRQGTSTREQPSASVTFQFVGIPSGARLVVGGTPIFGSSTAFVPRGSSPVPVEITANGFEPLRFEIVPTENHTIPVQMRPAVPAPPPPPVVNGSAAPQVPSSPPAPRPRPATPTAQPAPAPVVRPTALTNARPETVPANPRPATEPRARPANPSGRSAATGTLFVNSASPCLVTIDGQRAGSTPVRQSLTAGEHVVRCLTPPARIRTQNVSISVGQFSTVTFD